MSILIDETKRVLVQGITGREGMARTRLMLDYGTQVVGGVTPGKAGLNVLGVPVFDTPGAAVEAIEAGVKLCVLVPDRVPVWDAMEIAAAARANNANFVGPNTLGILSPGRAV